MRIAYFAHVNGGFRSGVYHKIVGQIEQWRARGHVVRAFLLTRDRPDEWQAGLIDPVVCRYSGVRSRMGGVLELVRATRRFQPTIVYMRRDMFYPQTLWLPAEAPLVVEVNADDLSEYALGPRARSYYNALTRGVSLGRASGLVFVTNELRSQPSFRRFNAAGIVVTNGIDLASYPELPAPTGSTPRLVFIGTAGQPWHGIDKLMALASMKPEWRFDIIGTTTDDGPPLPNVTWHGPLDRVKAIEVMARADVGVGTLALHRNSLNEASSLKVREYLAVGLPVLYANHDADADRLAPYTLRIANIESNVVDDLRKIEAFVEQSKGVRVPRSKVTHIDVVQKERDRLALFESLAGG